MAEYSYSDFMKKLQNSFKAENSDAYVILIKTDTFEVFTYKEFIESATAEKKILDIRAFDTDKEYRLYRDYCGKNWNASFIDDNEMKEYDNMDTYDDYQYLDVDIKRTEEGIKNHSGMIRATGGGWYKFPASDIEKLQNMKIKIRNYICYDENGQAYIKTWRVAGFKEVK